MNKLNLVVQRVIVNTSLEIGLQETLNYKKFYIHIPEAIWE